MKKHYLPDEVVNRQSSYIERFNKTTPVSRLIIGLFFCAVVAFYGPLFLMNIAGIWVNVLTMWLANSIVIVMLVLLNLIGNRIGRIVLLSSIVTFLIDCYVINLSMRVYMLRDWNAWLPNFFFVNIVLPLNAYLFLLYNRKVNL